LASGISVFAQAWASTTARVWQYFHSRKGSKLFVDGFRLRDWTPAAIADLLNAQDPKELTAGEVFQLAESEE
jgi:hypothetical protein